MNRPIWFINMCSVIDWSTDDAEGYLAALIFWCPFINKFLDDTLVKGNANAQAVVDLSYRLFTRFADFLYLTVVDSDTDSFKLLRSTYRRLDGLTTLPNHKSREKKK